MAKVTPIQTNFAGGEISPRLYGRIDLQKYASSLEHLENFLVFPHGGVTKRSGTRFIAEVKDSSKKVRLVPFIFSTEQAYILEFGDEYIRFYRDEGQIQSSGSAYELASPWGQNDLVDLDWTQSADILYVFHKNYQPRKVSRTGHTSWTITNFETVDGPFGPLNNTATTMTASATSGTSVTITASGTTGVNDGDGFQSTDVGRHIRTLVSNKWGSAKITGVTDTTHCTVSTFENFNFGATSATDNWKLGAWSDTTKWPTCATFYQQRFFAANTATQPNTVWASETANFDTFSTTDNAAEVTDDRGLDFTLNTDQVNAIRWMYGSKVLQLGTADGPFIMSSGSDNLALTPTNVTVGKETTDGTADIKPIGASKATLFVDRNKLKIRELAYSLDSDGFTTPDMSLIAEHITTGNISELAYARSPDSIVFVLLATGELRSMTYERAQDVVAWSRHTIGGTNVSIKSIGCIPSTDESQEQLYLVVSRTINGATKQYVELLEESYDSAKGHIPNNAFFVDSGLTYSGSPATSISGLAHLEGQVVAVLADGATHANRTVSSGAIALSRSASVVHVGLPYTAKLVTLDPEVKTDDGVSQGKTRRVERVTFRVADTYGLKFGPDADSLSDVLFRTPSIPMGSVQFYSGDKRVLLSHTPNRSFELHVSHDVPHPCTILAIMYALVVSDR